MTTTSIASRSLALAALALVATLPVPATAEDTSDANEDCLLGLDPCIEVPGSACPPTLWENEGLFAYEIADNIRVPVGGAYYWATAVGDNFPVREGGRCHDSIVCTITVIDAGHVDYADVYNKGGQRTQWLQGEWMGVPFTFSTSGDGFASCDEDFGFEGYIAALVPITGAYQQPGTPLDMLGPLT